MKQHFFFNRDFFFFLILHKVFKASFLITSIKYWFLFYFSPYLLGNNIKKFSFLLVLLLFLLLIMAQSGIQHLPDNNTDNYAFFANVFSYFCAELTISLPVRLSKGMDLERLGAKH